MQDRGSRAHRALAGLGIAGPAVAAVMLAIAWSDPPGAGACNLRSASASSGDTYWLAAALMVSLGSLLVVAGPGRRLRDSANAAWMAAGACSACVALAALVLLAGVNVRGC